jgi:mitogen-activated protein kinase 1/3
MASHNQLELILNVLGTPTIDEFYAITSRRSKEYIRSLPFRKKQSFKMMYPNASDDAIDFLKHTLTCKPSPFQTQRHI